MAVSTLIRPERSRAMKHIVSVAKDFSKTPGPRFARQGAWSGEAFRRLLVRALNEHGSISIVLDGTRGFGSSFLDEAFGGLVRVEGLSKKEVLQRVEIVSEEDPSYREEALFAIDAAG